MDRLPFAFYEHLSESLTKEEVEGLTGILSSSQSHCWNELLEAKKQETRITLRIVLKSENGAVQASLLLFKDRSWEWKHLCDEVLKNIRFEGVEITGQNEQSNSKFKPLVDLQSQLKFVVSRFTRTCWMIIDESATEVDGFSDFMKNHRFLTEFWYRNVSLNKGTEESIFEFLEFQVNHGQLERIGLLGEWPRKTDALLQELLQQEKLKECDIVDVRRMRFADSRHCGVRNGLGNVD